MRIELLDKNGTVMRSVDDIPDAAGAESVLPFYPGAVSWREVDPAVAAADDAVRGEEAALQGAVLRGIARVLFNYEGRIRTLEGRPAVTIEQFKAELKTILGI